MKNIKIVWILIMGLAITTIACNQDDVQSDDYSDSLMEFISYATNGDSTSTSGHKGHRGGKKLTQIEISSLPVVITNYISTNYVGSSIKHAGKSDSTGSYLVHIVKADSTHLGLKFDAAGAFVSELVKPAKGTHIEVSALPAGITSYITSTYAGATVKHAMIDANGAYKVLIEKSDATKLGLGFAADGTFTGELTLPVEGKGKGKGKRRKG